MSDTQWVQHFSGQGPKFNIVKEWTTSCNARMENGDEVYLLPKGPNGYIPCPPPERWEVVPFTLSAVSSANMTAISLCQVEGGLYCDENQRFTLRPDGALVLERKVEG